MSNLARVHEANNNGHVYQNDDKGVRKDSKLQIPSWILPNLHYECITGSVAYGCNDENKYDFDTHGFCIPKKETIFPHLSGHIPGFGTQPPRFDQWDEKHIFIENQEYDFSIYGIVKFFQLCMENNPNMIDTLFVPSRCITHITNIGNLIRDSRHLFLHKGCWHKFKGYAFSQLHKAKSQTREGKRREVVEKYGYDVKFAYHIIRLLDEAEQILTTHTLILDQNREQLKSIRRGEWTLEQIELYFSNKEKQLEQVYTDSKLQYKPDEEKIKLLLLNCLEEHYGSLEKAITIEGKEASILRQIKELIEKSGV